MKALQRNPPATLLVVAAVATGSGTAHAADAEGPVEVIHLEADLPEGCVTTDGVRAELAALGARFADANASDRVRTFRLEAVRADGKVTARLVVRDLVFRETLREISARDCAEATHGLGLLVATALDGRPSPTPPTGPPPSTDAGAPWPAPEADAPRRVSKDTHRAGLGVGLFGAAGIVGSSRGAHAYGTTRFGATRLGLGATFTEEERSNFTTSGYEHGHGTAARVGVHAGWGAPWTEGVVGFAAEAGASRPDVAGKVAPAVPCVGSGPAPGLGTAIGCYDTDHAGTRHWRTVSAFVSGEMFLQVPFKSSVRPVLGVGMLMDFAQPDVRLFAELGFVWRAW